MIVDPQSAFASKRHARISNHKFRLNWERDQTDELHRTLAA